MLSLLSGHAGFNLGPRSVIESDEEPAAGAYRLCVALTTATCNEIAVLCHIANSITMSYIRSCIIAGNLWKQRAVSCWSSDVAILVQGFAERSFHAMSRRRKARMCSERLALLKARSALKVLSLMILSHTDQSPSPTRDRLSNNIKQPFADIC